MNVEPPETLVIMESIVYKSNGFAIEGLINFINSNGDSREMKRALAVKLAL